MNDLLNLFLVILITGVIMGLINTFIPMVRAIKSLLNLLVLIVLIIYVLQFFHIFPAILPVIQLVH